MVVVMLAAVVVVVCSSEFVRGRLTRGGQIWAERRNLRLTYLWRMMGVVKLELMESVRGMEWHKPHVMNPKGRHVQRSNVMLPPWPLSLIPDGSLLLPFGPFLIDDRSSCYHVEHVEGRETKQ